MGHNLGRRGMSGVAVAGIVLALVACTGAPAATESPPATTQALLSPVAVPSTPTGASPPATLLPTPTESPEPTAGESATPAATADAPTPSPPPLLTPEPSVSAEPTATPAADQWIGPEPISTRAYSELSLVVDGSGIAHAAAVLGDGIFYLTNESGSWTRERLTTAPAGDRFGSGGDGEPSIALDSDGSLWIAFTRWQCDECAPNPSDGIFLLDNRGGRWSEPREVAGYQKHGPSLQVHDGRVHLAYAHGGLPGERSYPVFYATDRGGEWTVERVARNGSSPDLEVGADGTAHIIFSGDDDWLYAVSNSDGRSFAVEPIAGASDVQSARLALGSSAETYVAWTEWGPPSDSDFNASGIHLSKRSDGAWSEQELLPDLQLSDLALDSGGAAHVLGISDEGRLVHATNTTGAFETNGPFSEWEAWASSLAIDADGRPHLLFVVGQPGLGSELWYGIGPAR